VQLFSFFVQTIDVLLVLLNLRLQFRHFLIGSSFKILILLVFAGQSRLVLLLLSRLHRLLISGFLSVLGD